ncbi:MAG: cupin domain-containing protein [Hadesarchaea archaeon]|nr:cupin domain-containing protein [Hadesarchaea archaeon]
MKGLILAGGYGTRLGPIGQKLPKAMIMIDGNTALDHLINRLDNVGLDSIIVANEKFEASFESYDNVIIEETTSDEEKPGAISAINQIIQREEIDEDLFVLASDNYFSEGFEDFLDHYDGNPMIGVSYIGSKPEFDPSEMGTLGFEGCDDYPPPEKSFTITNFKEKSPEPLSDYIGTGAYIIPKSNFSDLTEFCAGEQRDNMGSLIEYFLENDITVEGYHFSGEWHDVSHRSYLEALSDGNLVKSDDRYIVVDKEVGGIVFSITILHPGKETSGHSHEEAGEVYFFAEGKGVLELDGEKRTVRGGDAIPISPGTFHRVYNTSDTDLVFLCAFEKYGERG